MPTTVDEVPVMPNVGLAQLVTLAIATVWQTNGNSNSHALYSYGWPVSEDGPQLSSQTHFQHHVQIFRTAESLVQPIVTLYMTHMKHQMYNHAHKHITYTRTHLAMNGHLPLSMICFSEKMCSCWRVSTMCLLRRHLSANVLLGSVLSCTWERNITMVCWA